MLRNVSTCRRRCSPRAWRWSATRLFQITWKHGLAYTYDRDTFKKGATFDYDGEGWGLCYDGHEIVMSDGSARLVVPRSRDVPHACAR